MWIKVSYQDWIEKHATDTSSLLSQGKILDILQKFGGFVAVSKIYFKLKVLTEPKPK